MWVFGNVGYLRTPPKREPKAGETWRLGLDPFDPIYFCVIRDVKDGWVRYSMGGRPLSQSDERLRLTSFVEVWQFYKEAE